ncbi:MAG: right-handed parallel beta-helix repeat-containing protein [Fimbriimonadaceae bacterium]|nr:right-handed parallel beta-helix repeat-containing protein [Fimbriimonadaceae bacterium]
MPLLATATLGQPTPTVELKPGLVITRSVKVKPGVYKLASKDLNTPAIVVRGKGITVDFNGAVLSGSPGAKLPDAYTGLGIRVEGQNVTIKNAVVKRYMVGLRALNVPGIRVTKSDFSYNWKQHLLSGLDREDGADWMSYHRNEKDEWLRYGAGIYLRGCDKFEVDNNVCQGGQNALMLTECNDGKVWNNDFSFLSSAGVLMYLSSRNKIMHNKIDWCVRGYSHGVYNRGQDSAGIIIYEQSNDNVFAYNSVTHGGDGFFLWAGQTTMDTGKGGCNDNLLYGNDFSHAPTNGIEATFSRNKFVNNLIMECWHGIWGGYSYETLVQGNVFALNAEAIAIEHGQDNVISHNTFDRDTTAVYLWWNANQDPNWAYPKHRDTRSMRYVINENVFSNVANTVFAINNTVGARIENNKVSRFNTLFRLDGPRLENIEFSGNTVHTKRPAISPVPALKMGPNNFVTDGAAAGGPLPMAMQPSGNVVIGLDPDNRDYLKRFARPWNPLNKVGTEFSTARLAPEPMKDGMNPFLKPGTLRGRRFILVDEWGPYDFKSPKLWPRADLKNDAKGFGKRFEILGPDGTWKVKTVRGVASVSARSGKANSFVDVWFDKTAATDMLLDFEFVAKKDYLDPFGNPVKKGVPTSLKWSQFRLPIDWTIKFYSYDDDTEPRTKQDAFMKMLATATPLRVVKSDKLDYASGGSFEPGLPSNKFATVAEGTFSVPPGTYTMEVTSDDGIRVFVDGKKVLEDWTWHGPKADSVTMQLGGKHRIRVEHFEIDGYSALKVGFKRG